MKYLNFFLICRNLSSTLYDPFSQGTSSNADPSSMGECHVSVTNASDGELPPWPQAYTNSSGHPSTLMPSGLLPQFQVHFFILHTLYFIVQYCQIRFAKSRCDDLIRYLAY